MYGELHVSSAVAETANTAPTRTATAAASVLLENHRDRIMGPSLRLWVSGTPISERRARELPAERDQRPRRGPRIPAEADVRAPRALVAGEPLRGGPLGKGNGRGRGQG